jgi:hypothetical protein
LKKLKSSARQGAFISEKIAMLPTPPARWMAIKVDVKVQHECVTRITVGPLERKN